MSESDYPPKKAKKRSKNVDFDDESDEDLSEASSAEMTHRKGPKNRRIDSDNGDFSIQEENHDYCDVCMQGGEIMLCDSCPRSYHLICILPDMSTPPEGVWNCPTCVAEGVHVLVRTKSKKDSISKKTNEPMCRRCRSSANVLITCQSCGYVFHPVCIGIPAEQVDDAVEYWVCKKCSVEPLPGKIEKIITWRAVDKSQDSAREYFVKWIDCSYWKCSWVSTCQLEVFHGSMLRSYLRRADMSLFPTNFGHSSAKQENQHSRWDELIANGIRADWLTIQRLISHHDSLYLVKWRDLPYDQCTWEEYNSQIIDMDDHIDKYHDHIATVFDRSLLTTGNQIHNESWERLHPYQSEGVNWLSYSWQNDTNTILADEMGLGKTIQSIMFISKLFLEERVTEPFLLTVPLTTLINWEREFEIWAPYLYVVTYIGDKKSRGILREYEFECSASDRVRSNKKPHHRAKQRVATKFHVLLTSYELICIDQSVLSWYDWQLLIVDEAHRLKNSSSKFFKILSQYTIKYTVLLTGTPLQNNLKELFHLMNFLEPRKFNDCQGFLLEFADIAKEEQIEKLHKMLGSHMLRRLKSDVLVDLPGKSELIIRVDLTTLQKKYCKYILTKNFDALNTKGNPKVSLLNIVMELKKLCNHPYLFQTALDEAPRTENGALDGNALIKSSGKLDLMAKMLRQLYQKNHRVLIFSQMTRMLDVLEEFLEHENYKYERIDGGVTGSARQDAIDRFNAPNAEQFVFLLSTRAGGLGVNLATADTVVIYDSDWNPHNDIQAFSRAHRIGQSKPVLIYRFVTRNSVEERIAQVAKRKMMLTHLVVRSRTGDPGANKQPLMSKKELDDILRFGTEDLFKTDENDETEGDGKIIWDDEAVSKLLDRQQDITQDNSLLAINEYLSSFKVAECVVKPDELEVVDAEDEVNVDPEFWTKLLGVEYQQQIDSSLMGKGMRTRKPINYGNEVTHQSGDDKSTDSSGYSAPSSGDESHSASSDDSNDVENVGHVPMKATVHGQVEIYGLNARQRRTFCNNVIRYGLPTPKHLVVWRTHRDLSRKSTKELEKYLELFCKHLSDPQMDSPIEGVNNKQVLTRIAIMNIIHNKVEEFGEINGFSFEEFVANKASKKDDENAKPEDKVESTDEALWDFNICERGFTDLHVMWLNEEKSVKKSGRNNVWNRKHDFWLLAGIYLYGYGRWQDINNDIRFSIINAPFNDYLGKPNYMEIKNKALSRRFRVLEQALTIEDQCNRSEQIGISMSTSDPVLQLYNRFIEFGHIVECNKIIFERADEGNQFCVNLLQKVFEHLEKLTTEMRQELLVLPTIISGMSSVSSRLGMSVTETQPEFVDEDLDNINVKFGDVSGISIE